MKENQKYTLDTKTSQTHYIVKCDGQEVLRWSKRANTLDQVKKALEIFGVADYEIIE